MEAVLVGYLVKEPSQHGSAWHYWAVGGGTLWWHGRGQDSAYATTTTYNNPPPDNVLRVETEMLFTTFRTIIN